MALAFAAGSADYPVRLLELGDPPQILYASGPLPRAERWVAIVGSRKCSEGGRDLAHGFAKTLAERGIGVVSGGAIGIDAAAHRGALEAKGATIVVLPSPIHRPSPRRNWRLFGDVVTGGGALISEMDRVPRDKSSFRDRNRMIAALADLVLIVEAGPTSGTRYTVRAARRLGRRLGAVPWPADDPRGAISQQILARGGTPIRDTGELLDWLSLPRPHYDAERDPVLVALGEQAISIDRLAQQVRLPIPRLLRELSRLTRQGRIQMLPGSRVRRA
jgi:DNA processing protein